MSCKVSKNLVLVFVFLLNWLIFQNVSFGVTAAALETGLEIENLKSEQRKVLQKREGNYEENYFTQNLWSGDKINGVLGATQIVLNQEEPKEKRTVRDGDDTTDELKNTPTIVNVNQELNDFETKPEVSTKDDTEVLETFSGDSAVEDDFPSLEDAPDKEEDFIDDEPFIITPSPNFNDLDFKELENIYINTKRSHDTLVLKSIEEDLSFEWADENVQEWKRLKHEGGDYYIGRRLNDLLMIPLPLPEGGQPDTPMVVNVGHPITSLDTYSYWSFEHQQQEGVIVVSTGKRVLWYKNNSENQKFELYGNWSRQASHINQLKYFSATNQDYLIVCANHSSVEIYNFNLTSKKMRRKQSFPLEYPCEEVVLLKTGKELMMAIPQQNKVNIYNLNFQTADYGQPKFQFIEVLESPGLQCLQYFKVGGRTYLALGGEESQILLYHRGHFETKFIFDRQFGVVEFFLPLVLNTYYRDDLILLVQHRSLNLTSFEALIWNGESFDNTLPIACHKGPQLQYGLAYCLWDSEEIINLKGSNLLKREDQISLIVPYFKGKSRLFHLHTEIMPENFELLALQEIFDFLKAWSKERDDFVAQAQLFLDTPLEVLNQMQDEVSSLDNLETPEFQFTGEVEDIFLNDYKWSKEDSELDLNVLINTIEELEKSLSASRQRRELNVTEALYEDLNFDVVEAEELEIENLNGSPFYIQNSILDFQGEVQFSELEVLDKVVEREKRQLEQDFQFEGDLEFDFINDIKWSDLKQNLVLRTQAQELELLKVEGEVIVEDILRIKTLNSLAFPEDYLVSNGPRSSIVRAEKYFNNTLSANSVDTDGLINGQNPVDAITLMDRQEWQGSPIFNNLEVSEILELHGAAHGRNVANFPENPTLKESNVIEADCIFNELQVNGPIVIKGDLNEKALGKLLKDIIQKPEDPNQETVIPSPKTFGQFIFPLDFVLENNTINQIPSEKFVTIHTPQLLNVSSLDGYVYFYNLSLQGLYDGHKIEDVLKEVIMVDKPLDMSSTELIFENDLQAETLIILDKINDLPIKNNLQTLEEDVHLETAEFEELLGKTADFRQDIRGPGKLNNIELHDFVSERSWHEPPVQGNLFLNVLDAAQGLQADELHGLRAEHLLDFLQKIDALPEMVLNGQIQVDHITVTGNVQVNMLNKLRFDEELQSNVIWLKRPNSISTLMHFKNPLEITGDLTVKGHYQGRFVPDFMEDIVIKDDNSSLLITAPKSFLKPVYVLHNSQVEAVNDIHFDNIALKTKENVFHGSLKIKGKLLTPELEIQGQVNDHNFEDLENIIYYDPQLKNFVLRGEILFENPISVEDLSVEGDFNDLPNLGEFFENLIDLNGRCYLKGNNTFTGRVSILEGAFIFNHNNIDLVNLFKNMVFIQGHAPVAITSPVVFEDVVKSYQILVHESLKTTNIDGCPLQEWLNNTLRVDQDQYIPHYLPFSTGALDGNSLNVHFINDLDLSRIITLNTAQEFEESVEFSEVHLRGILEANGLVNGVNLEEEYNNTLMIYGGQHITTPLTIQSILVLRDLQVLGVVNGNKDLSDVATLTENLELQCPVYFQSLYSPHVITKDLVSGIDFTKWFETTLRAQGNPEQNVVGNWSTRSLTIKSGPKDFQYTINGFEPLQYNAFIRSVRSFENGEEEEICEILKEIWKKIEQKTVVIKRIEEDFVMDLDNVSRGERRRKLFHLPFEEDNFLLLNVECISYLYKWNSFTNRFDLLNSYESGPINHVMVLNSFNLSSLQFITTYESTESLICSFKGVNVWNFKDNKTLHQRSINQEVKDWQKSKNSLWLLTEKKIKQLDLKSFEIRKEIGIPFKANKETKAYGFIPQEDLDDVVVLNGMEVISVLQQKPVKTKTKKQISLLQIPSYFYFPSWLGFPEIETTSYLKPNASMARKFAFSDFTQVLERLLLDLSDKLNQQINITQLSIPESDLFDEHLTPDFVDLMDRLQKQQLSKEIREIPFENLTVPETPSQVLAFRVLQIVWPVVEEMEEIHSYLKDNKTHNHPLCSNITKSLASLMKDVLKQAHSNQKHNLFKVIERIRLFDQDLKEILKTLNTLDKEEEEKLLTSASERKDRFQIGTQENPRIFNNFIEKEEMLSFLVGTVNNTRRLIALTKIYTTVTPGQDSSIYLYGADLQGNPYQIINAYKPHSLIHLRLKQETLLMFIENCCQVQVWSYQGTRGFVKFMEFEEEKKIVQILTMTLPQESKGKVKHYLVLLMEDQIKFNEIMIQGISQPPPKLPCS